ncbi:hypothetical protein [Akkermansia sp.]|uniref:hypothetical protein n=1 Tax=Akkermansia sp. TaxID=1872421 RepID=UPI003994E70E
MIIGDPLRLGKRLFGHQLFPVAKKLMPALAATHHGPLLGRWDIDMLFAIGTVQIHSPFNMIFLILLQYPCRNLFFMVFRA